MAKTEKTKKAEEKAEEKTDEEEMTKLGVDEDKDLQKEATTSKDGALCPTCQRKVEQHGTVSVCPVHGTEPFEGEYHVKRKK
jgi:hypothetical protein